MGNGKLGLCTKLQYLQPLTPTAQIDKPYVMAGINVMVAETDAEAEREFTSVKQMFADIGRGRRRQLQPPIDPGEVEGGGENPMLQISAVGSPETATRQMSEFVERTGAAARDRLADHEEGQGSIGSRSAGDRRASQ